MNTPIFDIAQLGEEQIQQIHTELEKKEKEGQRLTNRERMIYAIIKYKKYRV